MIEIVYILGSTRSGTSALRNALAETRFKGYGEGHLAPILVDLIRNVRQHKATGLGAGVEGNGLNRLRENPLLRRMIRGYERYLAEEVQSESILDKTPTIVPIRAAPDLNRFHDKPYFLHCARRHVDNIASKQKKFPDRTLEQHCREWADCNLAWLDVRPQLEGNCLSFDFFDIAVDPEGMAGKIGAYLRLTPAEVAAVGAYLDRQRPQASADRDLTRFLKLSETGWTEAEQERFRAICGPVGERIGYGYDTYFA